MTEKTYTIPDWMEPFLDVLGGRSEVERLMSGPRANTVTNAPLALVQMGMEERITILSRLHQSGMLIAPPGESTYHFEPRWVCGVGRSGYNNGSNCTPGDPHEFKTWHCAWRYELSVYATETTAATLREHGFHVEPPKPKKENPA